MKVQVTSDRNYLFAGKSDLKILEMRENKGTLLNKGKNIVPFIDIKLLGSEQLMVHEESTLDLAFYDGDLREIKRLPKAANGQNPFHQSNRTIKHGTSRNVYGWYAGNEELRLVNLHNGELSTVNNFFGTSGQRAIPIAVAVSDKERKAVGLYNFANSYDIFLSVLSPNGSINRSTFDTIAKHKSNFI